MDIRNFLPGSLKGWASYLFVVLLTLGVPLLLFRWQTLDNNSLTAWRWVFAEVDGWRILLYLLPVVVLAYVLASCSFYEKQPFWLVLASFAVAAGFWSEPEVIMDAARYFTQAKHLELYGTDFFVTEWGRRIFAWTDLPLLPFLYGLIFKFLGESRIFIQIFNTFLFSGTVWLTYLTGRLLWNEQVGFYGGLLLLGIPYLLTQVPLMLVDVPTMFFLLLCIFTFSNALDKGGIRRIILAAVSLFLVFFAKYSTWLMLTVLPVIFLYYLRSYYLRTGPRSIFGRAAATVMLALLFVGPVLLLHYAIMVDQIDLLLTYQKPGLARWSENFSSTFLFQVHPLISVAAIVSFFTALRRKEYGHGVVSYLLVLLLVVMQVRRIRYILPLFPLLTLLASYGLTEIKNRQLKKYVVFCCVGSALVLAFAVYLPFLQRLSATNLQQAGRFLDALAVDQVEVFAVRSPGELTNPAVSVQVLDIFTEKRIIYEDNVAPQERRKYEASSLRFTWEQENPVYYEKKEGSGQPALVILSSRHDLRPPEALRARTGEFRYSKEFTTSTDLFRHRTLVTVFYN